MPGRTGIQPHDELTTGSGFPLSRERRWVLRQLKRKGPRSDPRGPSLIAQGYLTAAQIHTRPPERGKSMGIWKILHQSYRKFRMPDLSFSRKIRQDLGIFSKRVNEHAHSVIEYARSCINIILHERDRKKVFFRATQDFLGGCSLWIRGKNKPRCPPFDRAGICQKGAKKNGFLTETANNRRTNFCVCVKHRSSRGSA